MFAVTDSELLAQLQRWLWPFLRVSGLLLAAPVIGTRTVPVRIRAALALLISLLLAPTLPGLTEVDPISLTGLAIGCQQLLIGVAMGLVLRMMFSIVEMAGQLMAQQMGLGFASLVDPQTGGQVPVYGQFYILLATLLFLGADGHLHMLHALQQSFALLPIGTNGIGPAGIEALLDWAGSLFSVGLLISLPLVAALLVVNVALGVMARAAPQLNLFAIGFPVMLLIGVAMSWLALPGLVKHGMRLFDAAFLTMSRILVER